MSRKFRVLFTVFCVLLVFGIVLLIFRNPNIGYSFLLIDSIIASVLITVFVKTKGLAHLPEQTVNATVTAKNVKSKWVSNGSGGYTKYFYMVYFVTDDSVQLPLCLSLELYNALLPGDYGEFTYKVTKKGKKYFISYIRCYR